MRPSFLQIMYTASSNEQTGDILYSAQFEEGNLAENERNIEEDETITASIEKSYIDDESDDGSTS